MVSITDGMRGRGTLLPRPGLARSLIAFVGFVFLVGTFLLATLLATYNHNDPSWNHAIDAMPTNLLGKFGRRPRRSVGAGIRRGRAVAADRVARLVGAAAWPGAGWSGSGCACC